MSIAVAVRRKQRGPVLCIVVGQDSRANTEIGVRIEDRVQVTPKPAKFMLSIFAMPAWIECPASYTPRLRRSLERVEVPYTNRRRLSWRNADLCCGVLRLLQVSGHGSILRSNKPSSWGTGPLSLLRFEV